MPPILFSATIKPQTNYELQLKNSKIRELQYINNLIRFICESPFMSFIFCENSNSHLSIEAELSEIAKTFGKEIEFITFKGDSKKILELTRAYGDQEIMEYAFDNSKILQKNPCFYKITGRYWVKNIFDVVSAWEASENVFIRGGLGKNTVHTCFFKVTKEYFKEHFYGRGNQLPRFENNSLERLYFWHIKQSGIPMGIHGVHPVFSGEWGAGGFMDEVFIKRIKTLIFAKLGVYNIR